MKKINNKGFVLAETLVVTVFLMILFTMIYSNFYPLIGEYEKRENYDDVDGKYVAYWMKKLAEDQEYKITTSTDSSKTKCNNENKLCHIDKKYNMEKYGYFRLECSDLTETSQQRQLCNNLVTAYEIDGCTSSGGASNDTKSMINCEIYITNYRIGGVKPDLKETVKKNLKKYQENCTASDAKCKESYISECITRRSNIKNSDKKAEDVCKEEAEANVFSSGLQDYIMFLPDYTTPSLNLAKYRVIVAVHHTKDYNNYLTYSTTEVNK